MHDNNHPLRLPSLQAPVATSEDTLRGRLEWLAFAAMVVTVYLLVPIAGCSAG